MNIDKFEDVIKLLEKIQNETISEKEKELLELARKIVTIRLYDLLEKRL